MSDTVAASYERRVGGQLIEPDADQRQVVEHLDRLRCALDACPRTRSWFGLGSETRVRGTYIWGDVGRGKSMLMAMFLASLDGTPFRRLHFHAFMQEVHRALHGARNAGAKDPISSAVGAVVGDARVFALDEVEVIDIVDAMIVGRVFERLIEARVVPVLTSNRAPGDLYRDGLKRELFMPFVRLIEREMDVLQLGGGTDYRDRPSRNGSQAPNGPEASIPDAVDRFWRDLCAGSEEGSIDLGREVVLRTNGRRAARGSFQDICCKPLASSDYFRLAGEIDLLVLDAVPTLGERQHDAARRLVTLVDILYETKCRLVMDAAIPPDKIYPEGEGAFEFRRTVSRMKEICLDPSAWARGLAEPGSVSSPIAKEGRG